MPAFEVLVSHFCGGSHSVRSAGSLFPGVLLGRRDGVSIETLSE